MSTSAIISEVSILIRSILEAGLTTPGNPATVEVSSPIDLTSEQTLLIWLYQVTPNAHLRNAPNLRVRNSSASPRSRSTCSTCSRHFRKTS